MFVTGHTGFKGSWLLLMLEELGAKVHGFALPPPTQPSLFELADIADTCVHHLGDVADLPALRSALEASAAEVVLHLAAQPLVRASYTDPVETYRTNVMGTVHLLDACRVVDSVRSIVVVTTDKCYDNVGWTWGYRENDRLGGADPYSNSKAAAELVVDAYRRSFFDASGQRAGLASARAGNVIGGGDFALDRLLPDAIRAFTSGRPLLIRNPLAVRPWQHVLEPLLGYLTLAELLCANPRFAKGWNFGPRTEESAAVKQVIDTVAELWGAGATWAQDPADHPHEAATLKLDSTMARLELGWLPQFSLEEALAETIAWYRSAHEGADASAVTRDQVRAYLSRIA